LILSTNDTTGDDITNLNNRTIPDDRGYTGMKRNQTSKHDNIICYFDNLEYELIDKIEKYPVIVGCVAWLTNESILNALATRDRVSIIIQKEDFLRPDSGNWSGEKLRSLYGNLPDGVKSRLINNEYWGDLINGLNFLYGWEAEPVRWCGEFNINNAPAFPRMHHKFLVFCNIKIKENKDNYVDYDFEEEENYSYYNRQTYYVIPKAVWTGSFNMTHNGIHSLENALFIQDDNIAKSYYDEWQYIFGLSEYIASEYWNYEWSRIDGFRLGS